MQDPLGWIRSKVRARTVFGLGGQVSRCFRGRPCLVLCSAPDPRVPRVLPPDLVLLCVNCAGYSAERLGLPRPDVTLLRTKKLVAEEKAQDRKALRGLSTRHLILVQHQERVSKLELFERVMREIDFTYETLCVISKSIRARRIASVTGVEFGQGSRDESKVSSGVAGACLALSLGATEVVMAGFSLDSDGLSYVEHAHKRYHLKPDAAAIEHMRTLGLPIRTSEPRAAELTGLPLVP